MTDISVVIPTCDRPTTLVEAVNCVLGQSYPAREIIVVNNGCQPLDAQLLPPQVRVYELPPYVGVSQARNQGVALATSDYVAFLDDDDLWEADYLGKVLAVVKETQPDCIITRLDKLIDGQIIPYKNAHGKLDLGNLLVSNPGSSGSSTVIRREPFFHVSGYDIGLRNGGDKALIIEFLINGYSIVTAPHIQAILREHKGPRIRNAAFRGESISRFIDKYGILMSAPQRNFNLVKLYYYRYKARGNISDYARHWLYFIIHSFYLMKYTALPEAPRLSLAIPVRRIIQTFHHWIKGVH